MRRLACYVDETSLQLSLKDSDMPKANDPRAFSVMMLALFSFNSPSLSAAEPTRPNILIIYADDLGYGETGVQGCKDIPTPHIDSIAKSGLRCTQ